MHFTDTSVDAAPQFAASDVRDGGIIMMNVKVASHCADDYFRQSLRSFDCLCMYKPSFEEVSRGLPSFFCMKYVLQAKTKLGSHWQLQ
jgi:hypothetical protein